MECKYCGNETANDSIFCEHCGKQLTDIPKVQSKRSIVFIRIAAAVGIAIGLVIAFYANFKKEPPIIMAPPAEIVDTTKQVIETTQVSETTPNEPVNTQSPVIQEDINYTISADKMKVLYAGLPNPITLSSTVSPDKLAISASGCDISRGETAGKFYVSVPSSLVGQNVTISVSANDKSKTQALGSTTFRVKRIPDPSAVIGSNIRGGKRTKRDLTANPFIRAAMGEDFPYDLRWTINSYQVIFITKGYEVAPITCTGGNFSEELKSKIEKSSSGTTIIFTGIKASCEAGQRTLDEISIRLK